MTIGDIEIQALRKEIGRYKKAFEDIRKEIGQRCEITVGMNNEPTMTLRDIFTIIDKHDPSLISPEEAGEILKGIGEDDNSDKSRKDA